MSTVCRLCLSEEGKMEPIFNSTDSELPQKIFECTTVKVQDTPELPCHICEICKSEMIIWMKFRRMCLKSNESLKAKFPKLFEDPIHAEGEAKGEEEDGKEEIEEAFAALVADSSRSNDEVICEIEADTNYTKASLLSESIKIETIQYINEEDVENLEEADDVVQRTIEMEVDPEYELEEHLEEDSYSIRSVKRGQSSEVTRVVLPNNRVRYSAKCKICGKERQNIKQHMRVHYDEKPFKCNYCGKTFRQRGNFTRHLNIHTGEKPYKCDECDAAFADPASLRAHKVRHTGSRAYPCDVCGKSYSHSHVLAAHKRIHTQDRRHACNFCDKRFLSSHSLKKHIRTHTGERPYKCSLCPKAFATSGNLRTHQLVHSKVKSFKCPICNDSFAYRCVLKAHMKKHIKEGSISQNDKNEAQEHQLEMNLEEEQEEDEEELAMQDPSHSDSDNAYDEVYEIYTE